MDLAPPKGRALVMARAYRTSNPIPDTTAKPSRRKLLGVGLALAAVGATPAAAVPTVAPSPDADLIRLADLAVETCRRYMALLSDAVVIPPEVDAELSRLSALADDCYHRAAEIRATTPAGLRAKARIVTLANSHNLSCVGDTAFVTLESLLDDLMGGEGSAAAFEWHVNRREGAL